MPGLRGPAGDTNKLTAPPMSLRACSREVADNFRTQILNAEGDAASLQTPVRTIGSVTFMYLRHSDIYILGITKSNANAMLAFRFMTSVRAHSRRAHAAVKHRHALARWLLAHSL